MGKPKKYVARIYLGDGQYRWVGRYTTRKERDDAKAEARTKLKQHDPAKMTVGEYADRFLRDYPKGRKQSSVDQAKSALRPFLRDFGHRELRSITRVEAKDWAHHAKPHWLPVVVTVMNQALDDELLDRNPFRGLAKRTDGRSQQDPPTEEEFQALDAACAALGDYGPQMRALFRFAAYSGLRPGELFALEWKDIDFDRGRIQVNRRLYRGRVDVPKSNQGREVALTPPAREALGVVPRETNLVFLSKTGKRLSQPTLSVYWRQVLAKAGLDFDFYLATKHYCAHYLWVTLDLPERVVAMQLGHALDRDLRWKLKKVYGHADVGAFDAIDRAFQGAEVRQLRAIRDTKSDADAV